MSSKKGFTLVEIILFLIVFSLGVVGIMTIFYNTLGKTTDPLIRDRGIQIAQGIMEEIISRKWDELTPNGGCKDFENGVCANPLLSSLGPDNGEDSISKFNDVDDFVDTGNNFEKHKIWQSEDFGLTSGFKVKITVSYANVDSSGNIRKNSNSKTPYKLIQVEVSPEGLNETYTLTAIKADF